MSKTPTPKLKYIRRIRITSAGRQAWYEVEAKDGTRFNVKKPLGAIDHLLQQPPNTNPNP